MLKELLHNKVYAILLFFFTLAILMWAFNYFGVYEGLTTATTATTSPTTTAPATTPATATAVPKSVTATTFAF
jgi:zona occludens toxin (predicted ATPase)